MSAADILSRYQDLEEAFELSLTIDGSDVDHAKKLTNYLDMALDEMVRIIADLEPTNKNEALMKSQVLKNPRAAKLFDKPEMDRFIRNAKDEQYDDNQHSSY